MMYNKVITSYILQTVIQRSVCKHWPDTDLKSLHGQLNCEIGELYYHVITTEYRTRPLYTHETPIL